MPRVYLGGMWMRMVDANGLGDRADGPSCEPDGLRGLADGSGAQPDAPSVLNDAEMVCVSHGEGAGTYLGTGDAKRGITETDGVGIHADASTGQTDAPSVETNAIKPENDPETISIPRMKEKPPDLPMETTRGHPDEPDGCGNPADMSSICTDTHSIGVGTETAEIETGNVRIRQNGSNTQNSPKGREIVTPKSIGRWRNVSVEDVDVYLPWDAPVEVPSRTFAFGQVEDADQAIAPNLERAGEAIAPNMGETARDGDGDGDGDDGDMDGATSSGDVDLNRVEEALLAVESQYVHQDRRRRNGDSPVSSVPPVHPAECPYGDVTRRR